MNIVSKISIKRYLSDNAQLMGDWNWERNKGIDPSQVTLGSNMETWWKCSKGHEWEAKINNRSHGTGCPYCAGKRILKGNNDLQTINPSLAMEWNYEKNGILKPDQFTANSGKKVWWKCSKGHEWQATIANRNNGLGCPYCSGKKVLKGYNDLQTINNSLAKEWNYEKNGALKPEQFTANSGKKAWWKCSKGHEWKAAIGSRNTGAGCPYCSGHFATKGVNDLQTLNPSLAKEWNYEKNGIIKPEQFTVNSNKKVWWRCSAGHEWQATIGSRNTGAGCPYCSCLFTSKGVNDLQTVNPTLANEWNYEKNGDLTPERFTANSGKIVWWRCKKGHEWKSSIIHRNQGTSCPYCSGKMVLKGYNDLQTTSPYIANEWNYEKNGEVTPDHFTAYSNKTVWWKCKRGHEWQAQISNRSNGRGCPICNSERNTSFPEYAIIYYLKKYNLDAIHSFKEYGFELDIYIPAQQIAIEFDGYYWHKNRVQKDLDKNCKCKRAGIKLYRIREGLPALNDSSIGRLRPKLPVLLPKLHL